MVKVFYWVKLLCFWAPLLFVIGMIFVGISMMRAKLLPSVIGLLLIIGTIVFALGTVAGNLEPLISTLGSIITGLGFIWGGFFLFRRSSQWTIKN